jgi:Hemolysin coregulated protein Hcp (TssD)
MASFTAFLNVGGGSFPILTCDYSLSQPVDPKGRPTAGVTSNQINVLVVGNDYEVLTDWAADSHKKLNGSIKFINREGATFKIVSFEDAYCVSYREVFTPYGGVTSSYSFNLGITSSKMHIGGVPHDNMWKFK